MTLAEMARRLKQYADDLTLYHPDDLIGPGGEGDVRLQCYHDWYRMGPVFRGWYLDGEYRLWVGLSDYDTDHTGFWGAASVRAGASLADCMEVARDLREQVYDHAAEVLG